jgi:histidine ammonia-lyase
MRRLLGRPEHVPARIQDPYGLRCLPQVHGPALDAAAGLHATVAIELNAAAENPLISPDSDDVFHHGGFHVGVLALAGDRLRLAVLQTAQLSSARLGALAEPALTGLRPFLADGEQGSSGTMILEYTAASALAALRHAAYPVLLGHAVLSRGEEEHASIPIQCAHQLELAAEQYSSVLATELLAAVRALRMSGGVPSGVSGELATFVEAALDGLPDSLEDRPLDGDIEIARGLLADGPIRRGAAHAVRAMPSEAFPD